MDPPPNLVGIRDEPNETGSTDVLTGGVDSDRGDDRRSLLMSPCRRSSCGTMLSSCDVSVRLASPFPLPSFTFYDGNSSSSLNRLGQRPLGAPDVSPPAEASDMTVAYHSAQSVERPGDHRGDGCEVAVECAVGQNRRRPQPVALPRFVIPASMSPRSQQQQMQFQEEVGVAPFNHKGLHSPTSPVASECSADLFCPCRALDPIGKTQSSTVATVNPFAVRLPEIVVGTQQHHSFAASSLQVESEIRGE
jgi:hypothetical protein